MGVMRCSREGCENIMCDRHNSEYGYICNECFDEFINYLICVGYHVRAEEEGMRRFAQSFMEHPKDFKFGSRYIALEFCEREANKIFPMG